MTLDSANMTVHERWIIIVIYFPHILKRSQYRQSSPHPDYGPNKQLTTIEFHHILAQSYLQMRICTRDKIRTSCPATSTTVQLHYFRSLRRVTIPAHGPRFPHLALLYHLRGCP